MKLRVLTVALAVVISSNFSVADTVEWNIDSSQSWIRMAIPDQDIDIGGGTTIFAGLRGAQPIFDVTPGATNPAVVPWSDDRGARAGIQGTILSDYQEGTSISFTQGTHNATLVESGQWIPNRNKWNGSNFDFHKPEIEGHPAAFAAELTLGGIIRVGHVALYSISLYADGTANLSGGGGTWTQSGGTVTMGGDSGSILDFWAQILAPSSRTTSGTSIGPNNGTITIEDLGNDERKMTVTIDIDFILLVSGLPLQNSKFTGQIVAFATLTQPAVVVDRSVYHGGFSGGGTPPDNRIDTGKVVAKEGAGPTALDFPNVINTSRGINGLVFDIENLGNGGALSASDFEVQLSPVGAFDAGANPPAGWPAGPAPSSVTVTAGSPSRVLVEWPNNSIMNRWLRLTIKANANTGLTSPETYYLGHLLGETTGLTGTSYSVTFADITPIRSEVGLTVNASSITDIDKTGSITFGDISAMRPSVGSVLTNVTIP